MRSSNRWSLVLCLLTLTHNETLAFQGFVPSWTRIQASRNNKSKRNSTPKPIDPAGWAERRFPAKEHCSKCGLCETTFVSHVKEACAFLEEGMSRMDDLEVQVHGRGRNVSSMVWSSSRSNDNNDASSVAEEARFGVLHEPMRLAKGIGIEDAQWTGVVTSIALSMLEAGEVDAVVCIAAENDDSWSSPEPIVARTPEDVLRGRGVKPSLAPSLRVLDEIQKAKIKRLLFCGVGCAVQAFRVVQKELELDEVYVLGTNCADNSPTPEAAERFLRGGVGLEKSVQPRGYEFMQDFRVHIKTMDGGYVTKPYFSLPGTIAEQSIAKSCLACFDYTNGLADVVVGYMGAPLTANTRMDQSLQTLTIRNARGAKMVQTAVDAGRLLLEDIATGRGPHEQFSAATVRSDTIVQSMIGGSVLESGMPVWMGEIMAFAMRQLGPTGVNFARYSIDYHILRNYLHVLDFWGEERSAKILPSFAREIATKYVESDSRIADLRDRIRQQKANHSHKN